MAGEDYFCHAKGGDCSREGDYSRVDYLKYCSLEVVP